MLLLFRSFRRLADYVALRCVLTFVIVFRYVYTLYEVNRDSSFSVGLSVAWTSDI